MAGTMATLLPLLASREDYDTLPFDDLPAWLPGLREILGRHGLPADPIEAFADGERTVSVRGAASGTGCGPTHRRGRRPRMTG